MTACILRDVDEANSSRIIFEKKPEQLEVEFL